MEEPIVTIITPTIGADSLFKLIESLQGSSISYRHIILWDDKRVDKFLYPSKKVSVLSPYDLEQKYPSINCIVIKGSMIQGKAAGSALRSVGLMAANTPFVTFADDDVWFEDRHLEIMMDAIKNNQWVYCVRKIWTSDGEYLGEDRFESVGNSKNRKVPYEMVDNNSMMFSRRMGSSAAVLYRETKDYNDDRLMYAFLKKHAGIPSETNQATVNQICPKRLEKFFRQNCTK